MAYSMKTYYDPNAKGTFERVKLKEMHEDQYEEFREEFGCSVPIQFITVNGIKRIEQGKSYDENLNEIKEPL